MKTWYIIEVFADLDA